MTTDAFHSDFEQLAGAVEIHSTTQYTLLGELRDFSAAPVPVPDLPPGLQPGKATAARVDGAAAPPGFLPFLASELYKRLYTRPTGSPSPSSDPVSQRGFMAALSTANTGRGTWEPGWKIVSSSADGRLVVLKDQVTFWVPKTDLRVHGGNLRPGAFCRVWVAKELRSLVPGFYMAIGNGNEQDRRDAPDPVVRIYWNLTAGRAVPYMALITTALNQAHIPFRTKVLHDPEGYLRADSGVLYLERRYFAKACTPILKIYEELRGGMRSQVPMFTKELAPGLGLAEDPSNGMSFGQSRCILAAQTLWESFVHSRTGREAQVKALAESFRKEGIDPLRPFLSPGSIDVYTLSYGADTQDLTPLRHRRNRRPNRARKTA